MSLIEAHLLCLGLFVTDVLARACRIRWVMQGLKQDLSLKDAFVINSFGDAANSLTPMRIAGEPARLAGMLRIRLPATAALLGIALEAVISRLVLAGVVLWIVWQLAPAWWLSVGPRLVAGAKEAWPWIIAILLVGLLLWRYTRRVVSPMARRLNRSFGRVRVYWRSMPWWPLVVGIPLSLVSIAARVAMLPVLAFTLPSPPTLGVLTFGSFSLLYSQMVLPTPSGAGVVDLGFVGGAAGEFDTSGWLLIAWRFYTTGLGVLLGIWFAARLYGWPALRRLVRRKGAELRVPAR
ncbi:MAG TPA: lysylphosphatidylglycerol synthase transmembrane domain-containing protein [Gemmatimonadales bacterium]|nr:lysylphosphatidylglycerol synthase transmembrane domain-containing protein [Gemmatimonadales bacterium]